MSRAFIEPEVIHDDAFKFESGDSIISLINDGLALAVTIGAS